MILRSQEINAQATYVFIKTLWWMHAILYSSASSLSGCSRVNRYWESNWMVSNTSLDLWQEPTVPLGLSDNDNPSRLQSASCTENSECAL